jgi:hypothetical protein
MTQRDPREKKKKRDWEKEGEDAEILEPVPAKSICPDFYNINHAWCRVEKRKRDGEENGWVTEEDGMRVRENKKIKKKKKKVK